MVHDFKRRLQLIENRVTERRTIPLVSPDEFQAEMRKRLGYYECRGLHAELIDDVIVDNCGCFLDRATDCNMSKDEFLIRTAEMIRKRLRQMARNLFMDLPPAAIGDGE